MVGMMTCWAFSIRQGPARCARITTEHHVLTSGGSTIEWQGRKRNEEAGLSGTSNRDDMWARRDIAGSQAMDDYVDDPERRWSYEAGDRASW